MPWEDLRPIFRPETVHMGVMAVDKDSCTKCGLCLQNCPFRAWVTGPEGYPQMKREYECFSCFNCLIACPVNAISIADNYHVDTGYWATSPHPLPVKMPNQPRDAEGRLSDWTVVERTVFERRSVRNFKDKPVPDHLIRRVLEAARFAPSAGNCQPWKFIVVTDKALIEEMNATIHGATLARYNMYKDDELVKQLAVATMENAPNPSPGGWDPRLALGGLGSVARKWVPALLGAPVGIILAADSRSIGGPQLNMGICGQNMNLVARSLGLGVCWVGFIQMVSTAPPLMARLGLQPPWQIVTSVVLGYPRFRQEGVVPRESRPVAWFREGANEPEFED